MDKEDKDDIQDILDSYSFTEEQDLADYKLKLAERKLSGACLNCGSHVYYHGISGDFNNDKRCFVCMTQWNGSAGVEGTK